MTPEDTAASPPPTPGVPRRGTVEQTRLVDPAWRNWGTYLSERAWGTVREDYSADGDAWSYFPFDHASQRAYRWNEDGLAGWCDSQQRLCLGLALWNGADDRLKERPFGLTNAQGNHGEDVKDYWFYIDNVPSHAYASMVYKYPLAAFPYADLVNTNAQRSAQEPEFELFDALESDWRANRYVDVQVEYAKVSAEEVACRITVTNRSAETAHLHVLPQAWFRNTWSWGDATTKPRMTLGASANVLIEHPTLDRKYWYSTDTARSSSDSSFVFCENETNNEQLFSSTNESAFAKDGVERFVVHGDEQAINKSEGTKVASIHELTLAAGATETVTWVMLQESNPEPFANIAQLFTTRADEADEFYSALNPIMAGAENALIQRQALAGLLWCKQYYHYDVHRWLTGDPNQPAPPNERWAGRNHTWQHIVNRDIVLMPDAWEYPWYAAWDWGFHNATMALIDSAFAKDQMRLMTSVRYQHPHGQVPAYEWDFSDSNPPVQSWATWMIHVIDEHLHHQPHNDFLAEMIPSHIEQLLFWFNTKDPDGAGVFGGGFLGLDNIGVFNRDSPLPTGGRLIQVDGTAWMAATTLHVLEIIAYLSLTEPRLLAHVQRLLLNFAMIAHSLEEGTADASLWSEDLGFYRDVIRTDSDSVPLDVVSVEGLVPLFASTSIRRSDNPQSLALREVVAEFITDYPWLAPILERLGGDGTHRLFGVVGVERLVRIMQRVSDPDQLLSDYGVRSMSKAYGANPFRFDVDDKSYSVNYWPGESQDRMFGGNSNWRGPVWFPMNLMLIQSLWAFDRFYGDELMIEHPVGSGEMRTLGEVAIDLSARMVAIFQQDEHGRRPVFGSNDYMATDPFWRDLIPFHEYFHGDTGQGLGASHQTGWTATVALLIQCFGDPRSPK